MLEMVLKHHDGVEGEGTADQGAHGGYGMKVTAGIIRRPAIPGFMAGLRDALAIPCRIELFQAKQSINASLRPSPE
jgi:hypothetical protein